LNMAQELCTPEYKNIYVSSLIRRLIMRNEMQE
jgi:hypothetical protein